MLQGPHEEVSVPRLRLLLRRGARPARAWYRTGHALGRHSRGLGLSGLRNAQVRLRDGRIPYYSEARLAWPSVSPCAPGTAAPPPCRPSASMRATSPAIPTV